MGYLQGIPHDEAKKIQPEMGEKSVGEQECVGVSKWA